MPNDEVKLLAEPAWEAAMKAFDGYSADNRRGAYFGLHAGIRAYLSTLSTIPSTVSGEPAGWRYRYEQAGEDNSREWSEWIVVPWQPNRKAFSTPVQIEPLYASPAETQAVEVGE